MVLTNFECWAHGDSAATAGNLNFESGQARAATADMFNPRDVSHITSNGYYGYSYVNDANNNNNNDTLAVQPMQQCDGDFSVSESTNATTRCKKRCFMNDSAVAEANFINNEAGQMTAKRCRLDDGDVAAQYFNDFFSLPSTQIGTQACLMDHDMTEHQTNHIIQQHIEPSTQHQQLPRINQHYQGHLHRANRDVSRCMMSHMI